DVANALVVEVAAITEANLSPTEAINKLYTRLRANQDILLSGCALDRPRRTQVIEHRLHEVVTVATARTMHANRRLGRDLIRRVVPFLSLREEVEIYGTHRTELRFDKGSSLIGRGGRGRTASCRRNSDG